MSDIPETAMIDRCAGCAFRPGSEAEQNPWTRNLRNLCVMIGSPFECHDAGDGHLCRGFLDAFTAKLARGDYDRLPEWKRKIAHRVMDLQGDMEEALSRGEKIDEAAMMARIDADIAKVLEEERSVPA